MAAEIVCWSVSGPAPELTGEEVHLWRVPLQRGSNGLPACLSVAEQQRAERLLVAEKREQFVCMRTHLRHILARYLNVLPASLCFSANEHGKPFLTDSDGLHFNVSHSGQWGLLAVAGQPVGVDVEKISATVRYQQIAAQFFTDTEQNEITSFCEGRQRRTFYRVWTRKEALLKLVGTGFENLKPQLPAGCWHRHPVVGPGYVACVAGFNPPSALRYMELG